MNEKRMIFIEALANDGGSELLEYLEQTVSSITHSGMALNVLADGRVLICDSGDGAFLLST
jgi:hypothetical protein